MTRTASALATFLAAALIAAGCGGGAGSKDPDRNRDVRQDMMDFVAGLSAWARQQDTNFIVIPQNGQEIYSDDFEPSDPIDTGYFDAIDGSGREDLFYGYDADNEATPASVTGELKAFLDVYKANGKTVLVIDYINTAAGAADSYGRNAAAGYVGFAADHRDLDDIPATLASAPPTGYPNATSVASLSQMQNFLYIINPGAYSSKTAFLADIAATNFDMVLVDAFDQNGTLLTAGNVTALKTKNNGATRLAIAYMSIGEAEDYRFYWQSGWKPGNPNWLGEENPDWPGNYKVRYWDPEWQAIIYGNADAYLQKILDQGFDGVYLDIIDAFEYWESKFN